MYCVVKKTQTAFFCICTDLEQLPFGNQQQIRNNNFVEYTGHSILSYKMDVTSDETKSLINDGITEPV